MGGARETTAEVAERIRTARLRMAQRNPGGLGNAQLSAPQLHQVLQLKPAALDLWERALAARQLSPRGSQRVLRVARTICDLAEQPSVSPAAIAEALTYRSFDLLGERLLGERLGRERVRGERMLEEPQR
jgi:magnesium chelatase family protein